MSNVHCSPPSVCVDSTVLIIRFCSRPKSDICSAVSIKCVITAYCFAGERKEQ
jgi:hypothetical protein